MNRDVMCVNSLVDGLTKYKIYTIKDVKTESDHQTFYKVIDDYGIENYFKKERFIILSDIFIKHIQCYIEDNK